MPPGPGAEQPYMPEMRGSVRFLALGESRILGGTTTASSPSIQRTFMEHGYPKIRDLSVDRCRAGEPGVDVHKALEPLVGEVIGVTGMRGAPPTLQADT